MTLFSLRTWLASQIGCQPDKLSILERSPDGVFTAFARNGHFFGQARLARLHHTIPSLGRRRALIASWVGGRGQRVLRLDEEVVW